YQAHEVPALGRLLGLGNVPAGEVAAPHVDDLSLEVQLFHRLPDLLPGRFAIDMMHLVQIDMVSPQPLQAGLAGAADVERREPSHKRLTRSPDRPRWMCCIIIFRQVFPTLLR